MQDPTGGGKNTAKVFMSKVVHKKGRSADWEVLVLLCQVDSDCASDVFTDKTPTGKTCSCQLLSVSVRQY